MIAKTFEIPYYAVIFTSLMSNNAQGYADMAQEMEDLAKKQEGFLGIESVREEMGITVSYWKNEEAIKAWKQQTDHIMAQKMGKEKWYEAYRVRVAKVERDYFSEK